MGEEYENTRHNVGFKILDALAQKYNAVFNYKKRYAAITELSLKGKILFLIKPSTYVNLSGKAIRYWLKETNIPINNLLVIVDDIALPFGIIRIKASGSDGGHNGLKSIGELLLTSDFPRLRFGIENIFPKGGQVNYVLGEWSHAEKGKLPVKIEKAGEAIESFCFIGIERTMNLYNTKNQND
jgi:peptidyl-tRNA hydrolase, PTH1 family